MVLGPPVLVGWESCVIPKLSICVASVEHNISFKYGEERYWKERAGTMKNNGDLESQVLRRWHHKMEADVNFFGDKGSTTAGPKADMVWTRNTPLSVKPLNFEGWYVIQEKANLTWILQIYLPFLYHIGSCILPITLLVQHKIDSWSSMTSRFPDKSRKTVSMLT